MLLNKIKMIPRYNWDYKVTDLSKAFVAAFKSHFPSQDGFESIFKKKPIMTTSGRASLYAILKALELPEKANVGVSLYCCQVVFETLRQAGLTPRFLDIELDDYNLSVSDLERRSNNLSAVVAVHMFGHPANIDGIYNACGGIPVIEDCAQALFSKYKNNYTGFASIASFFSFRSGKYLSAGEGSAIFCQDSSLMRSIEKIVENFEEWDIIEEIFHEVGTYIKSFFYHRPWYGILGYPIGKALDKRLNLTAKTGLVLKKISKGDLRIIDGRIQSFEAKIRRQRENAQYLLKHLRMKRVFLPFERDQCISNYYQFAVRFNNMETRDHMAGYLLRHGIDTAKYLDDIIEIARVRYGYRGDCPNAEMASKTVLIIPNHYTLPNNKIDYIISVLNEAGEGDLAN